MSDWNADWSHTRAHWPELFDELGLTGRPDLLFMEIGCFEGQSALWTLEHILTDPSSRLVMIDPLEFTDIDGEEQWTRIERHLRPYLQSGQAVLHGARSESVLRNWKALWEPETFDVVYIDGDHYPSGVIVDAVLSWPLVKPGGHLLFDDYVYELGGHPGPRHAIDAFAEWYDRWTSRSEVVGVDQYLITKES